MGFGGKATMILIADFKGDASDRWKNEVVDLLARRKKKQHLWPLVIDAKFEMQGSATYAKGLATLRRYKYDILILGRVAPGEKSAKVTVLGNGRGLFGEVTLSIANNPGNDPEGSDQLNDLIEESMILTAEIGEQAIRGIGSTVDGIGRAAKKFENVGEQIVAKEKHRSTQVNRARLQIDSGNKAQDADTIRAARSVLTEAYREQWFGEASYLFAGHVGHSFVYESQIVGSIEGLVEGLAWYREAASSAEEQSQYEDWLDFSTSVIGTCLQVYQSTGDSRWLYEAYEAQAGLLELASHRLPAEEAREAYELVAYCAAIRSAHEVNLEEFMFALENLRDYGRFDMMEELESTCSTARITHALRSVRSVEAQREHWQGELRGLRRKRDPRAWALAHNRLAICYAELGERDRDTFKLALARKHFSLALKVWTESGSPSNYAMVMDNLGNLYCAHYRTTGQASSLPKAVIAHGQALKYRTESNGVREWASTARNAAMPLFELARIEHSTDHVDKAISLMEQAVSTCENMDDKDMLSDVRRNLAVGYEIRFELSNQPTDLDFAIRQWRAVLADPSPIYQEDDLLRHLKGLEGAQILIREASGE